MVRHFGSLEHTLVGSSREGKVGIEFREQGWSPIQ